MIELGKKSIKILYVFGIVFFIYSFAYSQDSFGTQNYNSLDSHLNSQTVTRINQNSDTLQAIYNTNKEEKVKQQDTLNTQNKYLDETLSIGSLVIDHTQSKWGRDFVDLFNKSFDPPDKLSNYTVVIEEKPLPQFGTVILMKVNGNYVYQRFIQPRYETIKVNARQATAIALQYLANYQQIQKELQGKDLKGTGIY